MRWLIAATPRALASRRLLPDLQPLTPINISHHSSTARCRCPISSPCSPQASDNMKRIYIGDCDVLTDYRTRYSVTFEFENIVNELSGGHYMSDHVTVGGYLWKLDIEKCDRDYICMSFILLNQSFIRIGYEYNLTIFTMDGDEISPRKKFESDYYAKPHLHTYKTIHEMCPGDKRGLKIIIDFTLNKKHSLAPYVNSLAKDMMDMKNDEASHDFKFIATNGKGTRRQFGVHKFVLRAREPTLWGTLADITEKSVFIEHEVFNDILMIMYGQNPEEDCHLCLKRIVKESHRLGFTEVKSNAAFHLTNLTRGLINKDNALELLHFGKQCELQCLQDVVLRFINLHPEEVVEEAKNNNTWEVFGHMDEKKMILRELLGAHKTFDEEEEESNRMNDGIE